MLILKHQKDNRNKNQDQDHTRNKRGIFGHINVSSNRLPTFSRDDSVKYPWQPN